MNLLVTGAFNWTNKELKELRQIGHEIAFMQQEGEELPCEPSWVEGIIGNGIFLSHPIEIFTNLRYIQLTSAGFERVSMDYVREHEIKIFNARGVYSIPMAEFVVCGVLELYKQSMFFLNNQREHKWVKHRNVQELDGKTVGIVGCGSVGTECAKRFSAFGCTVLGVDIVPYDSKYYAQMVSLENLNDVLEVCNIVILTLPITEASKGMMNAERLGKMKKGSILVNIARGAVVDTEALIKALEDKLAGAVLDVFEEEPLPESNILWDLENVIISPHNSFIGDGNHKRLWDVIKKNLEEIR